MKSGNNLFFKEAMKEMDKFVKRYEEKSIKKKGITIDSCPSCGYPIKKTGKVSGNCPVCFWSYGMPKPGGYEPEHIRFPDRVVETLKVSRKKELDQKLYYAGRICSMRIMRKERYDRETEEIRVKAKKEGFKCLPALISLCKEYEWGLISVIAHLKDIYNRETRTKSNKTSNTEPYHLNDQLFKYRKKLVELEDRLDRNGIY